MNNRVKELVMTLTVITAMAMIACSDDDFKMNDIFIPSNSYAEYTDQVPIQLSTFRQDSVQTSGYRKVWVGHCKKKVIGDIFSDSYIKLAPPDKYGWYLNERYDSCTVILRHTGNYQGDTTKAITLNINRLATPLEFTEKEKAREVFYNRRTFRDSTLLGTYTFRPCPHTHPRIRMRLFDSFGKDLFKFIKDYENNPNRTNEFLQRFLCGIKLSADTSTAKSLLEFNADSVQIVLHTHFPGFRREETERVLTLFSPELQFNHTWNENITEPYNDLKNIYNQVTEEEGGIHSVLFEGLGYYPRINFPSLTELKSKYYSSHIVKATLKIYIEQWSYDKRHVPPMFFLSKVNRGNVIIGNALSSTGTPIYAILVNNLFDRDQAYYTADLTYYLNSILSQDDIDDKEGLVLTWGSYMDSSNYDFMLFNGHTQPKEKCKSELEIYYYNYDEEHR